MAQDRVLRGKVLFAAPMRSEFQKGMCRGLQALGWSVSTFDWTEHIGGGYWGRLQAEYLFGPDLARANRRLAERCRALEPDVLYVYKGIWVAPGMFEELRRYARLTVSYNPDNPFGDFSSDFARKYKVVGSRLLASLGSRRKSLYFDRLWGRFKETLPFYDVNFVPRSEQVGAYLEAGAKEVYLLPWYYSPELHRPVELSEEDQAKYEADVVFIGRYEPDHRGECLEALVDAGVKVRLYGTGWDHYLSKKMRHYFGRSIHPVLGEEYVKAICASKLVLNFNAKLNRDTSTIRCVEAPACGALLVSERTEALKSWFEEDEEAVYFGECDELVGKVRTLLASNEVRRAIALRGHKRCLRDGHDVYTRMGEWDTRICARLRNL